MVSVDGTVENQNRGEALKQQADALYREEKYRGALRCYEEGLLSDPDSPSLHIGKADCLRKLRKHNEALDSYNLAIKQTPQPALLVKAYNGLCYTYIRLKDFDNAWTAHFGAISLAPQNATAYNGKGMILYGQGDIETALNAFEQAILLATEDDNLAGFYYNKVSTCLDVKQVDDAIDAFYDLLKLGALKPAFKDLRNKLPKSKLIAKSSIALYEGELSLSAGKYEEALHLFNVALQLDSQCVSAYLSKGNILLELQRYQEAKQAFSQVFQFSPNDINALWGSGNALIGLKEFGAAQILFERFYALQPNHPGALTLKGDNLLKKANYSEALTYYKKALQREPTRASAHAGKGHALYALNKGMEALKAYGDAITYGTKDEKCYLNAGEILASLNELEEAQSMYQQALRIAPRDIASYLGLGTSFLKLKRYQEALASFQEVIKHDQSNIAAYMAIGEIYVALQADKEATIAYEKIFTLLTKGQDPELFWQFVNSASASLLPASRIIDVWIQCITLKVDGERKAKVLKNFRDKFGYLLDPQRPSGELQINVQQLAEWLLDIDDDRAKTLLEITGDNIRTTQMLIALEPFSISGLEQLARKLVMELQPSPRNDDLFADFYCVLESYGVPPNDADWFYSQILVMEQRYTEAQLVLTDLATEKATPDVIWLLAEVLEKQNAPAQEQLQVLQKFLSVVLFSDERRGRAWKRIGQLYEQQQNGMEAINAYKNAEQLGFESPQLQNYRAGHWEAIPALQTHPDFAFPPVVVIDLESEYQPDAPPGSTVFEIGAVRVKGSTELATYQAIIQRDTVAQKVAHRQHEAKPLEQVVRELRAFIELSEQSLQKALIVGHNLQAFDAPHLRALGLPLEDEQIIDTLTFARLLHPDSMQHNLSLLCEKYHIALTEAHHALPDAQACANLLHALGNELVVRGERLLAGFRAFVSPGSAFDRAILQPRNQAASPDHTWALDPMPAPVQPLVAVKGIPASPRLLQVVEAGSDALVERFDPEGAYVGHLPTSRKTVVAVATHSRLERLLVAAQGRTDLYVLPNSGTLLCPLRLRECIEREKDWRIKLALFCLYQASHNHDISTLFPLRLPSGPASSLSSASELQGIGDESDLFQRLKHILIEACCEKRTEHLASCPVHIAVHEAIDTSMLVLATHETFLHQSSSLHGDLLIVDDVDELQMHFAEYLAERVMDQEVARVSQTVYDLITTTLSTYVNENQETREGRERVPLFSIERYFTQPWEREEKSLIDLLKEQGVFGRAVADQLSRFFQASLRTKIERGRVCAYWLDLRLASDEGRSDKAIERWRFCGLNRDVHQAFAEMFWQPFHQRIFCGTSVTLGSMGTQFLRRFFGIPEHIIFSADQRQPSQVYIPSADSIRPSSFLGKRSWAEGAGAFLYRLARSCKQSIAVTLSSPAIREALAGAFQTHQKQLQHHVVSPSLGWTVAKINESLARDGSSTIAFVSPRLRRAAIHHPVEVEVTGPLRFLNQQDPLVAAQMQAFAMLYDEDGPFSSYLLPQALLELKSRLATNASLHIILDSALNDAVYRDEVLSVLGQDKVIKSLAGMSISRDVPEAFMTALSDGLDYHGLSSRITVDEEDLQETLYAFWQTESFRSSPLDQKSVIQNVFEGKDQLVIAATGGGKSLCFQLPAILLAQDVVPKVTLVVSPLIALMQDQIESLRLKGVFSAIAWNSTITRLEKERYLRGIRQGDYSIIYIAPEQVYSAPLREALRRREIGLISIDEAHCVSQWGHEFRTAYFKLKDWIDNYLCERRKRAFPLLALTATARKGHSASHEKSTIEDIVEKLDLQLNPEEIIVTSPERSELAFRVEQIAVPCPDCQYPSLAHPGDVRCTSCKRDFFVEKSDIRQAKIHALLKLLSSSVKEGLRWRWDQAWGERQRGIIYCRTRKETEDVCDDIRRKLSSLRVDIYHGGLSDDERYAIYQRFISDGEDGVDVVVATNAFGMGIDARRLGFVIHFDVPSTLEAYYQEAGRAGRDAEFRDSEEKAQCILLYHASDLGGQRFLNNQSRVNELEIEAVYKALSTVRSSGQQEILVTESQIERLSGVEAKKASSCLYYLEQFTKAHGEPVLLRQANATKHWQIKFEQGYEQRSKDVSPDSRQLIEAFCQREKFLLNETRTAVIDSVELAEYLYWEYAKLQGEYSNLVKRQIIAPATSVLVQWHKGKEECMEYVTQIVVNIRTLLNHTTDVKAFLKGETVSVDVQNLYDKSKITVTPIQTFYEFVSILATTNIGDFQVLESFDKVLNASREGWFRLRLKRWPQLILENTKNTLQILAERLGEVVQRFNYDNLADEWFFIDLLKEFQDYEERQRFSKSLQLLKVLGLLTLAEEKPLEIDMRIAFLQENVSLDDLKIDLTSLRLIERYKERKLDLMRDYAMLTTDQRRELLLAYFFGEKPLIEPFMAREELTREQKDLVMLPDGYHLIQGSAGSGKTTVLEEHFRYVVEHLLVPSDRILVTAHLHGAIGRLGNRLEHLQNTTRPIAVKTIQSLAERIFRANLNLLMNIEGKPYFSRPEMVQLVSGSWEERRNKELGLISEAISQLHQKRDTIFNYLPVGMQYPYLAGYYRRDASKEQECLNAISLFKSRGIFPPAVLDIEDIYTPLRQAKKWQEKKLGFYYAVYISYQLLQGQYGFYTYDDQILFALAILRADSEVLRYWKHAYEHIIVDEFQDFSPAAVNLVEMLSRRHRNVLAVGDANQRILMSFAEEVELDEAFELIDNETSVQSHYLTTNFRSVQEILDFADAVLEYGLPYQQVAARGSRGIKPAIIEAYSHSKHFSGRGEGSEARLEAMIEAALHYLKSLPPEDAGSVALLAAKSAIRRGIEKYLRREGQSFAVLKHEHRYQSYHAKRYLTYLHLIQDSSKMSEAEHLLRHCISPYFKTGQVGKLKTIAGQRGQTLLEVALDPDVVERVGDDENLLPVLQQHVNVIHSYTADSLCNDIWPSLKELLQTRDEQVMEPDGSEVPGNVEDELEEMLNELGSMTVQEALDHVDQFIAFIDENKANKKLVVSTIDHAKSQEFDTVFLLGADQLNDPRRWYVNVTRAKQRFFAVLGASSLQYKDHKVLASVPKGLFDVFFWP